MTKNKSRLVPTRIVNKNGVSTLVYKKPTTGSNRSSRIPSPTAASNALVDRVEWINDRLTKPANVTDETMLESSRKHFSAELGDLAYRVLSTGTSTGQRMAANVLSRYVGLSAEFMQNSKNTRVSPAYSGNAIHGEVIRCWNYGNVREEAGLAPDDITDEHLKDLQYAHSMITTASSPYDDIPEEAHYTMTKDIETHWRGAAALSLCFDFEDDSADASVEWEKLDRFIPWVATQPDIGTVIRVSKQHNTIDPDKLTRLLDADSHGVHGSMTAGWL